jgi:hypothetical protein
LTGVEIDLLLALAHINTLITHQIGIYHAALINFTVICRVESNMTHMKLS